MTNALEIPRKPSFKKVTIAKLTPAYGKKVNDKKGGDHTISSIWW